MYSALYLLFYLLSLFYVDLIKILFRLSEFSGQGPYRSKHLYNCYATFSFIFFNDAMQKKKERKICAFEP